MKFAIRSAYSSLRFANTNVVNLMDDRLFIIIRAWGSTEYNQKFIDEVQHYLASTDADLDVTTPFDYQDNISPLANKTRIALLLAHDLFYKNENKNEFLVGFESTILFKSKNELAWSSVGRFAIDKIIDAGLSTYLNNGSDLDIESLLPVQLIGLEKSIDISSGSIFVEDSSQIIVSSLYRSRLQLVEGNDLLNKIDIISNSGTYWLASITQK